MSAVAASHSVTVTAGSTFLRTAHQRQFGLFPQQGRPFALVALRAVRRDHHGNHAAVGLGNQRQRRDQCHGSRQPGRLAHGTGVAFRNGGRHARRRVDPVVLLQLASHPTEGVVGTKVGDRTLRRGRIAAAAHLRGFHKGPLELTVVLAQEDLFDDRDFTEGTVPVVLF